MLSTAFMSKQPRSRLTPTATPHAFLPLAFQSSRTLRSISPVLWLACWRECAGRRKAAPDARFIVTAACDTPFFPLDLVERLLGSTDGANPCIALAASGGQIHPVFGLWPIALAEDLVLSLEKGTRKVLHWTDRHPHCIVEFAFTDLGGNRVDPFFNANTPEDLAEAERLLTGERTS